MRDCLDESKYLWHFMLTEWPGVVSMCLAASKHRSKFFGHFVHAIRRRNILPTYPKSWRTKFRFGICIKF